MINNSFTDQDARYIVNDFCNTTINKNQVIDQFDYADTTALRVVWSGTPTLDTDHREGDYSLMKTGTGTLSTTATMTPIDVTLGKIPDEFQIVDEF